MWRANLLNLVARATYLPRGEGPSGLIRPLSSPLPLSRFRDWKKKSMPFGAGVQISTAKGITALQLVIKLRTDFLFPPPHPTRPPINLPNRIKADTHEGFCSRSMLQTHFTRVSTHEGEHWFIVCSRYLFCSRIWNCTVHNTGSSSRLSSMILSLLMMKPFPRQYECSWTWTFWMLCTPNKRYIDDPWSYHHLFVTNK